MPARQYASVGGLARQAAEVDLDAEPVDRTAGSRRTGCRSPRPLRPRHRAGFPRCGPGGRPAAGTTVVPRSRPRAVTCAIHASRSRLSARRRSMVTISTAPSRSISSWWPAQTRSRFSALSRSSSDIASIPRGDPSVACAPTMCASSPRVIARCVMRPSRRSSPQTSHRPAAAAQARRSSIAGTERRRRVRGTPAPPAPVRFAREEAGSELLPVMSSPCWCRPASPQGRVPRRIRSCRSSARRSARPRRAPTPGRCKHRGRL